ncbi:MAG TPA: ABC transporter ATP-binding protein [Gaiellaceae bacterium]|nr:ABC transporter ATP-binding protein [Gaiellaceae bacterium]
MTEARRSYLHIDAATKVFAGAAAVRDFTLDIADGEFVSLLGPSGCGKTTLLRMIAGFEFPDSGRILLEGRDITAVPAHKRPVNMVFQRVTLFPHLNVFENIAFGLQLKRVSKEEVKRRVGDALDLVRLPGFGERAVGTLSGGQAQRVALARAIVNRPKVLLFDEPLSALDLQIRRELQVELKDIHRELESTFVYVTHDQEEAMTMSDRIVVMRGGLILQVGDPIEVYRSPASLFVASFVGNPNVWPGTVAAVENGSVSVAVGERSFAAPTPPAPVRVGDPVALVLRAEALTLSPGSSASPGLCAAHGTVADVRFAGTVVSYRVDLGDRQLTVSRPPQSEILHEGEPVTVTWSPRDSILLPPEDERTP